MVEHHWLLIMALGIVYCQTAFGSSSQAKVSKSAFEHLRDRGIYIIQFSNTLTELELQHFAAVLEEQFTVEIIEKFFIIKCLTARLSKRALHWVRIQLHILLNNYTYNSLYIATCKLGL